MKIEKISINSIKPYENNAKLHPQEQIDQIKASILEFGNNDPIAIDENNVIIEGHGRYLALQQLNYDEVEVIKLNHLSDAQKKAYIIAHNKTTLNSDFDFGILQAEFEQLRGKLDLELTGFTNNEIEHLFEDSDIESFFTEPDDTTGKDKKPKEITCPHCGLTFMQ